MVQKVHTSLGNVEFADMAACQALKALTPNYPLSYDYHGLQLQYLASNVSLYCRLGGEMTCFRA